MQKKVYYEQPLNERMRAFLRLEFLFKQVRHTIHGKAVWDSRAAIASLLDIAAIFARGDLKAELLKELERHASTLLRLKQTPGIDSGRLEAILAELSELSDSLQCMDGQIGQHMKGNELLAAIRQRSSIPGGSCDFDLPAFHFWLQRPAEERIADLEAWFGGFETAHQAVSTILRLTRHSSTPTTEMAPRGVYQQSLPGNMPCQMVRVAVPAELHIYPEISGGKHRFTLRFLAYQGCDERPVQLDEDVEFELVLCVI